MKLRITLSILASAAVLALSAGPSLAVQLSGTHAPSPAAALASPSRTPANVARDRYRHPSETLSFFGVKPNHAVVEIWPGGGWYTEILAPYLASGGGRLILGTLDGQPGGVAKLQQAHPAIYG